VKFPTEKDLTHVERALKKIQKEEKIELRGDALVYLAKEFLKMRRQQKQLSAAA
jgi:uncharacterized membrane protein